MYILGISAFFHDSAASLFKDGVLVCAFEEERFSRIKHDNVFPKLSVDACLTFAGITIDDVACVAYYEKPLRKFERILETFVRTYPRTVTSFIRTISEWSTGKLSVEKTIHSTLNFSGEVRFYPHHLSHAAAAFYTAPFSECAVVVIDGVGEYETLSVWNGDQNGLTVVDTVSFPHSVGLLYSTITAFLGFRVNSDEYKVMGLASYGNPVYLKALRALCVLHDDGSFELNMRYFAFEYSECMWTRALEELLGAPRISGESITQMHKDIAKSLQMFTEEIVVHILNHVHAKTGKDKLCLAGGVALNVVINGGLATTTPFKDVHIFGPAGDSGAAIGAGILANKDAKLDAHSTSQTLLLGHAYDTQSIVSTLEAHDVSYEHLASNNEVVGRVVDVLKKGHTVAWFQGRMEFGPRALGARSILAHPGMSHMRDTLNALKGRELFRPFALSLLAEETNSVFGVPVRAPHMNLCLPVTEEYCARLAAVVHVDGTTRFQTVEKDEGIFRELLEVFYERTGLPGILNTSFNASGEPIVESPEQALKTFLASSIDVLVIGNCLICKNT